MGHRDHALAQASAAAVLTVAAVAARCSQRHRERALPRMRLGRYLSGASSVSRFNRRLHRPAAWLRLPLAARGAVFLLDSMPVPACRRARAWRGRKVRGADCCGYCAAERARSFGRRWHLVCTPAGMPVAFALLPGRLHDLPPLQEVTSGLPAGAAAYADKADTAAAAEATILAETGVRVVPIRQANMRPNRWADTLALRASRKRIAGRYSQLAALGVQRLRARTTPGRELKLHPALLAATIANAH